MSVIQQVSRLVCGRKMLSVSMQGLEQLSFWQEKRRMSSHWYNIYNPVISVELTKLADRVVRNNEAVQEIQLDLTVHQHRVPEWNENLLMSMNDGLLRAVQRWMTSQRYSMKTQMLFDATSSGTDCPSVYKMCRSVDKYSSVCVFSVDHIFITHHVSHVRLAKF